LRHGDTAADRIHPGRQFARGFLAPPQVGGTDACATAAACCLQKNLGKAKTEKSGSAVLVVGLKNLERLAVGIDLCETRNGDSVEEKEVSRVLETQITKSLG
jgi:hypothetical protein